MLAYVGRPVVKAILCKIVRFADSVNVSGDESPGRIAHDPGTVAPLPLRGLRWIVRTLLGLLRVLFGNAVRTRLSPWVQEGLLRSLPKRTNVCPSAEGLNVLGSLTVESGLGEWARSTIRAARRVGIDVSLGDFEEFEDVRAGEEVGDGTKETLLYDVNVFHFNPNQLGRQVQALSGHFDSRYNIGCWIWETPEFPDEWQPAFEAFNEIWTPSSFSQKAIQRKADIPVIRIPVSVSPEVPTDQDRRTLGLPEGRFIFLTMADFYSCPERKNPLGVLDAYSRAFGPNSSEVCLVLKLNNTQLRPDIMRAVEEYLSRDDSIIPFYGYMDRPALNALINACDCLVSLHRAEGFGLPIAEAMYMGKPVIATNWSGNTDFVNDGNSLLVDYEVVEIARDIPGTPYKKGHHWAEPNGDDAAEQMSRVATDQTLARDIGVRAMQDIRAELSAEVVGELIQGRLDAIRSC